MGGVTRIHRLDGKLEVPSGGQVPLIVKVSTHV